MRKLKINKKKFINFPNRDIKTKKHVTNLNTEPEVQTEFGKIELGGSDWRLFLFLSERIKSIEPNVAKTASFINTPYKKQWIKSVQMKI